MLGKHLSILNIIYQVLYFLTHYIGGEIVTFLAFQSFITRLKKILFEL